MAWLRVVLALGFVLFLVVATSRWLTLRSQPAGGRGLRLLGLLPLGAGRGVAVVQIGPRALVLGLGDRSVSLLCLLDDPAILAELEPPPWRRIWRRGPEEHA